MKFFTMFVKTNNIKILLYIIFYKIVKIILYFYSVINNTLDNSIDNSCMRIYI